MLMNVRRNFSTCSKFQTNKTNCNGRNRSQTHTYELHTDGRRTHTNWNEIYLGPIRKYTQVDVGGYSSMCDGAFNYVSYVCSLAIKLVVVTYLGLRTSYPFRTW